MFVLTIKYELFTVQSRKPSIMSSVQAGQGLPVS